MEDFLLVCGYTTVMNLSTICLLSVAMYSSGTISLTI
jgi:hypothetical protein